MTAVGGLLVRPNRSQPMGEASLLPLGSGAPGRQAVARGIPRIIHQTYSTRELPDAFARAADAVRALNPSWEYRFYDDAAVEAFIAAEYPPAVLRCFQRINPVYGAARVDLFRYLLMFRCGGVYLDIKSRAIQPLDDVLSDDDVFVTAHWGDTPHDPYNGFGRHPELAWYPRGELQQWHIMSQPGHPFLEAVIRRVLHNLEHYNPFRYGVGKMGVIRLTGPIPYTEAIVPLLALHPHRIAASERELGLGYTVFSDGGQHKGLFTTHYSHLDTPIVPVRAVVERPFNVMHQLKQVALGAREQVYRAYRVYRRFNPKR